MSTSYGARVIVGVALKDVYTTQVKDAEKKQFDKDTGKPFKVPIKELHGYFGTLTLPPVEFKKKEYSYREEARQDWDFLTKEGLKIYLPSWEGGGDPDWLSKRGLVGISVCSGETDDEGSTHIDAITEATEKVKKALAKFGCTLPVKVFCQLNWG